MPGLLALLHAVSVAYVGDFGEQKIEGIIKTCAGRLLNKCAV